jgi:hypothetical protein
MMPITNALENAKRLEGLGFTHDQAHGLSELLEQTAQASQPDLGDLVTKDYLHGELQTLESRILRELRSQMFWFFGMLVGLLGLTIAIIKFLP